MIKLGANISLIARRHHHYGLCGRLRDTCSLEMLRSNPQKCKAGAREGIGGWGVVQSFENRI